MVAVCGAIENVSVNVTVMTPLTRSGPITPQLQHKLESLK